MVMRINMSSRTTSSTSVREIDNCRPPAATSEERVETVVVAAAVVVAEEEEPKPMKMNSPGVSETRARFIFFADVPCFSTNEEKKMII